MQSTLHNLKRAFRLCDQLLNYYCCPNPKYIDKIPFQDIIIKRNKGIVTIYSCLFVLFVFDMLINGGPFLGNLLRCSFAILAVAMLVLSCRYHPQIFNCFFSFINAIYGPCALNSGREGVYTAYIFVLITPIYVQLVTRSFRHFIFQALVQNIYLNTIYKNAIDQVIAYSPIEVTVRELTYSSNLAMIFQVIFVILIESFFKHAYDQALIFEQKKNLAENQKVFLLGFSHELRNLINSLTGNVKLATFEGLSGRVNDLLKNAEVCGELLLHLINNVLDTGKVEIGELEINPVPTQTYDAFEKIWAICSELIKRKDLKGHMKIPKDLPRTLMIDHHRLTQIFLNLVGNAIKFTDHGSIDVSVSWIGDKYKVDEKCFEPKPFNHSDDHDEGLFEKEEGFAILNNDLLFLSPGQQINRNILKPSSHIQGGILKIVVSDTGCGMTPDQLSRLFQKFTQVTLDESKKKLGTGLGLFITKQLCQKMQGEVKVFSQKDRGTSFAICIPVEPLEHPHEDFSDLQVIGSFLKDKQLKSLIVDDAPYSHAIMKVFLDKMGIEVADIAITGLEAYKKFSDHYCKATKHSVNIVTMDLDMPIMNGKVAVQKIREFEEQMKMSPCFIIIISGSCDQTEMSDCLDPKGKIRANAFLRKPVKFDDLARTIISYFVRI